MGAKPELQPSRLHSLQQELAEQIAKFTDGQEYADFTLPALRLIYSATPTEPRSYTMPPTLCLIAQGAKRVVLGDRDYVYDANRYLITSVDLPVVGQIIEASPEQPYLGLVMELDLQVIRHLLVDSSLPAPRAAKATQGMAVSAVPVPLLSAVVRLLNLLDNPRDIPILAPLIQREILYRLLVGEQGLRLRQIAEVGSQSEQIARAIGWMKTNYTQPFKVELLAMELGMSASTFHHHFRAMTALSPLQFLKRLRLNEARRLMLSERCDAASAAIQVGYDSASQFSREYCRQFGAPPLRDIKSLQGAIQLDAV